MSMYFLDDTDDWPEYTIIKKDLQRLESEHQALSKKLREAESALKFDVANEELKAKVDQLDQKLKDIAKQLNESLNLYR